MIIVGWRAQGHRHEDHELPGQHPRHHLALPAAHRRVADGGAAVHPHRGPAPGGGAGQLRLADPQAAGGAGPVRQLRGEPRLHQLLHLACPLHRVGC